MNTNTVPEMEDYNYALCVGHSSAPEQGWLCVFDGGKDECQAYFDEGNVPEDYDVVFMTSVTEQVDLRRPQ
jgi:hypothetical protein